MITTLQKDLSQYLGASISRQRQESFALFFYLGEKAAMADHCDQQKRENYTVTEYAANRGEQVVLIRDDNYCLITSTVEEQDSH